MNRNEIFIDSLVVPYILIMLQGMPPRGGILGTRVRVQLVIDHRDTRVVTTMAQLKNAIWRHNCV